MTNEEKNTVVVGVIANNGCSGNSGAVDRLGFPGLCLQDGPSGVRGVDMVSAYPSGIHIGASWNSTLSNDVGTFMGAEFKKKGVNVALGPVVGPLGRVTRGGRNWEGFSPDRMSYPFCKATVDVLITSSLSRRQACRSNSHRITKVRDRVSEALHWE
jgi:beta-glucosidase